MTGRKRGAETAAIRTCYKPRRMFVPLAAGLSQSEPRFERRRGSPAKLVLIRSAPQQCLGHTSRSRRGDAPGADVNLHATVSNSSIEAYKARISLKMLMTPAMRQRSVWPGGVLAVCLLQHCALLWPGPTELRRRRCCRQGLGVGVNRRLDCGDAFETTWLVADAAPQLARGPWRSMSGRPH